jgi:hypothetical protein
MPVSIPGPEHPRHPVPNQWIPCGPHFSSASQTCGRNSRRYVEAELNECQSSTPFIGALVLRGLVPRAVIVEGLLPWEVGEAAT